MSKATFDPRRFNNSDNEPFNRVVEKHLSRRNILKGGASAAALSMMSGFGLLGCSDNSDNNPSIPTPRPVDPGAQAPTLGFNSIAGSRTDGVSIPEGYRAQVLAPWGTPLNSNADDWRDDGTNTAIDQANSVGMHHDGMKFFPLNDRSDDGLLVMNHEYIDQDALHANGPTEDSVTGLRTVLDEVRKEINAHGVSVVRIKLVNSEWQVITDDEHNRRFTGATTMDISGPLAYSALTQTRYSHDGSQARGTLNNCGNGHTPWGTYLTCEENWPGYFVNKGTRSVDQERIGVSTTGTRYGWSDLAGHDEEALDEFARFDVTPTGATSLDDYRNEANGHGYIVEIDPYNPRSRAVKRTALGRFRHEGCYPGKVTEGKPVVFYSGHDSRFEYIYKFVSTANWDPADANPDDRLAVGEKYMDEGTLYVAKFNESGLGVWLPLTLDAIDKNGNALAASFSSQEAIILNTAGAADLMGATPMDRPEWCSVDPINGTVYMTLTNNTKRTDDTNPANPRLNNSFGHIIRWNENDDGSSFNWDIFVFGAPAAADADTNRSGLTQLNQFASPDGMVFDDRGIMWIQTDNGADEVEEYTNDQMLAVVPSSLLDENNDQDVVNANNQEQLKRFFVGPNNCEVTGLAFVPDNTSFFVNIQHPSNWPSTSNAATVTPDGTTVRPRAATVVIRKIDGSAVGV